MIIFDKIPAPEPHNKLSETPAYSRRGHPEHYTQHLIRYMTVREQPFLVPSFIKR
jgi:hypothetical protein